MATDGPKTSEIPKGEKSGGGGRKPETTIIQSKDNKLEKKHTSGGPDRGYNGGGKQGAYRQPY